MWNGKGTAGLRLVGGITVAGGLASPAIADYYGAVAVGYTVNTVDFGGAAVYLRSNDMTDTLLNVYDFQFGSQAQGVPWFQSAAGTGWRPLNFGGPFDGVAVRRADSFVTIGGFGPGGDQAPGVGQTVQLDPNFGGPTVTAPQYNAGWYNSSPPSLSGLTMEYSNGITGVLIGRFTSVEDFTLVGTRFSVTWNNGLLTPGASGQYTVGQVVSPSPGAVGLMGAAGLMVGGRRRRSETREAVGPA
jgi:hypothetical protein